jgi:glycosyltransferase involved in cell wall biosynthesis
LVPTGEVDKVAEAIVMLLKDQDERTRLATVAQQAAAASFDVKRMIAETEEIYRAVIQEKRKES